MRVGDEPPLYRIAPICENWEIGVLLQKRIRPGSPRRGAVTGIISDNEAANGLRISPKRNILASHGISSAPSLPTPGGRRRTL